MKPKKLIKIFSIPSHQTKERTSGVDFVRIIQPSEFLNGYEDDEVKFQVEVLKPDSTIPTYEAAKNNDIIFMNYIANPWGFAELGAMVRKFGKKIVLDTDDDLLSVQPDNPAYKVYHKGTEHLRNLIAIYNEVDYLSTTNDYLKNVLLNNTYKSSTKVKVFPNYIDLDNLYTHRSPFKNEKEIVLWHFGSTTHFIDLENKEFMKGIDRLFKEYPNVVLKTTGAFMPTFKERWGQRYTNSYGHTDVYTWIREKFPKLVDEADIIVVPLENNAYTRCKSGIKFLEASSAMKPGVYQNMRQYSELVSHGLNGMLANSADDWYESLKKLIDDVELRRRMGQAAFKTVEDGWQMKQHVSEYASFFKEVLDKN